MADGRQDVVRFLLLSTCHPYERLRVDHVATAPSGVEPAEVELVQQILSEPADSLVLRKSSLLMYAISNAAADASSSMYISRIAM